MPPLKAQLLLAESLAAYFPEMVFTDSGITVQIHRNTHQGHKRYRKGASSLRSPIKEARSIDEPDIPHLI
ncbi:hypothetical protein [Aeromonas caviae]|uniref:hypothetical protein n=1 Tax=Aeromonas caviae TaxID=648 RepID=UPI000F0CCDD1|nr:hypothetical protein ACGSH8M1_015940 [Aeromonas caviae]BBT52602.1 hypothetical protein WP8S18C01_15650 [Aeromonas caviae]